MRATIGVKRIAVNPPTLDFTIQNIGNPSYGATSTSVWRDAGVGHGKPRKAVYNDAPDLRLRLISPTTSALEWTFQATEAGSFFLSVDLDLTSRGKTLFDYKTAWGVTLNTSTAIQPLTDWVVQRMLAAPDSFASLQEIAVSLRQAVDVKIRLDFAVQFGASQTSDSFFPRIRVGLAAYARKAVELSDELSDDPCQRISIDWPDTEEPD